MVTVSPYLPDIFQGIVQRVSDAFSSRVTDPFAVFFDKGIQKQVGKSVYQKTVNSIATWPLVWLVMPFTTDKGDDYSIHGFATCTLIIAAPTDANYTQQQRDDITIKPRLIPIYEIILQEIYREKWFEIKGPGSIKHKQIIRPYWGGSDVEGPNQTNLFKKEVDAIIISGLQLRIKKICTPGTYPLNQNTSYQPITGKYQFYDDLELIVDGGNTNDPIANTNTVVIPFLLGKEYNVVQRAFGQLRQERDIEVIPDLLNGGFALQTPLKFSHNDTYFIKIRPSLVL